MPGRIVTYAHRPKRQPREKQAVPLAAPAVVTRRARKPEAAAVTAPPPANDDRQPAPKKPAIVTTKSRKQLKLERAKQRVQDAEGARSRRR